MTVDYVSRKVLSLGITATLEAGNGLELVSLS